MAVGGETGIVTPEAVLLEFDTAGAGSRVLGAAIDILIQLTALAVLLMGLGAASESLGSSGWLAIVVMLVMGLVVLVGYPTLMETLWGGRTLGKAALGLRAVTMEGGPVRFRHALLRAVVGLLEIWLTQGLAALLAVLLSSRDQRLGDMAAGTLVLRERSGVRSGGAFAFYPPPGYEAYAGSLDTTALDDRRYQVVRSFLLRTNELAYPARTALSYELANGTALAMHHEPPPMVTPEVFLVCVAAAYQARHRPADAAPPPPYPPSPGVAPAPPPPPVGNWPG